MGHLSSSATSCRWSTKQKVSYPDYMPRFTEGRSKLSTNEPLWVPRCNRVSAASPRSREFLGPLQVMESSLFGGLHLIRDCPFYGNERRNSGNIEGFSAVCIRNARAEFQWLMRNLEPQCRQSKKWCLPIPVD